MNRVLFKGKRSDDGEWVEGYLFEKWSEEWQMSVATIQYMDFDKLTWNYAEVIPETVGQFSSLPDKNGNNIFDGDICRVEFLGTTVIGVIEFSNGCFEFCFMRKTKVRESLRKLVSNQAITVIGNIHDNPEL